MGYNVLASKNGRTNKMDNAFKVIISGLTDIGYGTADVEKAAQLFSAGRSEDLIRYLRQCRCDLMEQLHVYQKRVDRIDYLIRQTGKTMNER